MYAVELNYPVDVSKLMGSEGFGRGARVSEDFKSLDCCTTSLRHKDETVVVNALESASLSRIPDTELCRNASQLPICKKEEVSEQHNHRGTRGHLPKPGPDVINTQRKVGKMTRSTGGCSKRARVGQLEDTMTLAGVDDVKDINGKDINDETQISRQKNSFSGKRGDKRNFRVPMKPKFDSFSMKTGLASFTMASGGNNFLGLYGLKSESHDITKLVEDISLNELLDGTYANPVLGKGTSRKAANTTENFLDSVKKACCILPIQRVQSQSFTDIDSSSHEKLPIYQPSSDSLAPSCNGDKEETSSIEPSTSSKDSCGKPEMPASPPDFPFCQPKDILESLALPPAKDLDSLLLNATKPSTSTRNNSDTRSGKQIFRRDSLPPFPWSHTLNGCRTNSDTVKLLSNKIMCQGRWVNVPNTFSLPGIQTGYFTNLESLAYDPSLIPSGSKFGNSEGTPALSTCNIRLYEQDASSPATYAKAFNLTQESGHGRTDQWNVGHCPRILAAAQTLCDFATKSLRQNPNEITNWPKKHSLKAVKARKTKSVEKHEEMHATPSSVLGSNKSIRSDANQIIPSKRRKLSVAGNNKNLTHIKGVRKEPIAWSTPRSSGSSPDKSIRDSVVEIRHSTLNVVKPPCTMHRPAAVLDKPLHKMRKLTHVDWRTGR